MASLTAAAALAVSVSVVSPNAPSTSINFQLSPNAELGNSVETWASQAGMPRPEIDPRVSAMMVGSGNVAASDICAAVERLVMSLRYSDLKPRVAQCGDPRRPIQIVSLAKAGS